MRIPRPVVAVLAVVVATCLGLGGAGVAVHEPDARVAAPPSRRSPTTTTAGERPTTAAVRGITAVVPELQAFVEAERGLRFLHPVDVELVDDDDFEARLSTTDDEDRAEIRSAEAVLQAMGLLKPGVDLVATVEGFAGGAVLGFYDAETKELVVRGRDATPLVRTTLVHELTHALEDQHFGLDRPDLGDEAAAGFQALAEGSASRIEQAYVDSLTPDERRSAARDEAAQGESIPDDLPAVVETAFGFPYALGPDLVRAILRAGGQTRLDRAYTEPPASTEHVLEPARYLAGDAPRAVPTPRPDRPSFDDGEIGQLYLVLMLRGELSSGVAREAARGWGGDRYVAWRDGDRTCVRMDFVMDTPADTRQLERALSEWADRRPATASASGTSLRTCG